ncbi:MAG TPA: P63C domain-containing protein [Candidatus Methylacidiphilales bacterium]|nr:P63C domain-containing protein [Candidatus Methylacidiphilales bacterium]
MDALENEKSNGGVARAEALSSKQRSEIAKMGAEARWNKELPEILCEGVLNLGVVSIPCFVTHDGQRLISGRGMQEALRLVDPEVPESGQKPGSRMTRLLNNKKLKPLIFKDKTQDHFLPINARWKGRKINGHNAEMLADICEGMLEARSALGDSLSIRQRIIADQCEILLRAFAKVGITALVDEATGYQKLRPADGLRAIFDQILRKDLASWFKRFPDEYYENIYKLKGWEWPGMAKNRYSVVGHYTNDLIYERLVPGLKEEFDRRNPKNSKGRRSHLNQQWLDESGSKLFSQQMFTVLKIQQACLGKTGNKWNKFMAMMDDILPKKGVAVQIDLPTLDASSSD